MESAGKGRGGGAQSALLKTINCSVEQKTQTPNWTRRRDGIAGGTRERGTRLNERERRNGGEERNRPESSRMFFNAPLFLIPVSRVMKCHPTVPDINLILNISTPKFETYGVRRQIRADFLASVAYMCVRGGGGGGAEE